MKDPIRDCHWRDERQAMGEAARSRKKNKNHMIVGMAPHCFPIQRGRNDVDQYYTCTRVSVRVMTVAREIYVSE